MQCRDCFNLKTRVFYPGDGDKDFFIMHHKMEQKGTTEHIKCQAIKKIIQKGKVRVYRCAAGRIQGYRLKVPQVKKCANFN